MKFVTKLCDHGVQQQHSSQDHLYQNKTTFRLLPTLVVSIGIPSCFRLGSVLIVNWIADRHIVREYTSRLIARGLSAEERSLREHLDAAVNQGDFIAAAIGSGRFQFGEPALADFLSGILAAAPQVYGLIVSDPNGKALHLLRGAAATEFTIDNFNVAADSQFAAFADQICTHKHPYWEAPIYRAPWQETFLNYLSLSGAGTRIWGLWPSALRRGPCLRLPRNGAIHRDRYLSCSMGTTGCLPIPS